MVKRTSTEKSTLVFTKLPGEHLLLVECTKKNLFFRKNHRLSPRRRLFLLKPRRMWGSENACSSSLYIAILKFYLLTHMSMSHQSVPKLFEKKDTTSKCQKITHLITHSLHSKQKKTSPMNCALHLGSFPLSPKKTLARIYQQLKGLCLPAAVALEELNARVQDQSFDADLRY